MHEAAGALSVALVTDVFPPGSGGSGWSTYYLGKALAERGHRVLAIRPRFDQPVARAGLRVVEYRGLMVEEVLVPEPARWASKLGLGKALSATVARRSLARRAYATARASNSAILHGQHSLSSGAVSAAARRARRGGHRVASVATVRDYWPLCPISTRLFPAKAGPDYECRDCHRLAAYLGCVRASGGGPQAKAKLAARWLPALLASKEFAQCDAVVAVSDYVHGELARSGRVPMEKLVTLPNLVDLPSVESALKGPWPLHDISPTDPFLLFAGKLDPNKGAQILPAVLDEARSGLPLVVAGDGPLRAELAHEAETRGLDFRFYDWLDNDAVLLLMSRAKALLFPSAWQEPLSRVLLEGCAAGAAIVALDTGGTRDILVHGESGWLAQSRAEMVVGVRRVVDDADLASRLRAGARHRAEQRFAAPVVSAQVEELYRKLLDETVRA
jgi:glycogen(starch) synthase